jgi:17beta-estradiol 17-dehydrogenase / very-long-chain 3-oxoacyl-CoA reductase
MFKRSFRSGIINLSSNSVLVPFPTLSVYSGTKAFDDVFSRCLTEDCKNTNIDVVSSRPNLVSTNATNHNKVLMACSPESTALGTLKALGKSSFTEGSFFHVFQTWFVYIMGEHIGRIFGSLTFNTMNKKKTA